MHEGTRKYRHYSAGQLDSAFVRISLKLQRSKLLTVTKKRELERLLVLIDEEREHRLPPLKEGIT